MGGRREDVALDDRCFSVSSLTIENVEPGLGWTLIEGTRCRLPRDHSDLMAAAAAAVSGVFHVPLDGVDGRERGSSLNLRKTGAAAEVLGLNDASDGSSLIGSESVGEMGDGLPKDIDAERERVWLG